MRALCRVVFALALIVAIGLFARPLAAQTPHPLAYWQFSVGEVLTPLGGPTPDWRVILGGGIDVAPIYEGAQRYRALPSVAVDIRYRDIAFLSDGDGLGINLLRGPTYRAGVAFGYDLGRDQHVQNRLAGLGSIDAAPEARLFAEYFLAPVVISVDARKGLGGHNGYIGDIGMYIPLPLAERFYLFTGPSVTLADARYMRSYFGVSPVQASHSMFPVFEPRGGLDRAGWGATAAYHWTGHWWLETEGAVQYLLGDVGRSPIVEVKVEFTFGANILYRF